MTEVPEHLLARSRARRAALGLGGDTEGAAAPVPAATADSPAPAAEAAASAPAASAAPEPKAKAKAKPVAPWVAAEQERKKIPFWASLMLVGLPVWALIYAFTLDPETPKELGPLAEGSAVYSSNCAACHGGGGEGSGANPKLSGGAVLETFPEPATQMQWVALGSAGWPERFGKTYGATDKPVKGGMPAWEDSLTPLQLMTVVLHERTTLSGEEFDIAQWEKVPDEMEKIGYPGVADIETIVEEWKATPPTS